MESARVRGGRKGIFGLVKLFAFTQLRENSGVFAIHISDSAANAEHAGRDRLRVAREAFEPKILDAFGLGERGRVDGLCPQGATFRGHEINCDAYGGDEVHTLEIARLGYCAELGDRKSTRLNSSHLVISYAVFCLKKKKKRKEQ